MPGIDILVGTGIGLFGGIKSSYKSKVDWSSPAWLDFHSKVIRLKNSDGGGAFSTPADDIVIGSAWRYIQGDFPQPDRDDSDTKNRVAAGAVADRIFALAALPINAGVGLAPPGLTDTRNFPPVPPKNPPSNTLDTAAVQSSAFGFSPMWILLAGLAVGIVLLVRK